MENICLTIGGAAPGMLGQMTIWRPVDAAAEVEWMAWRPKTWVLLIIGAALIGLLCGTAITLAGGRGAVSGHEYHLRKWEAEKLPETIFAQIGLHHEPDAQEAHAALSNYFRLTSEIGAAQQSASPDTNAIARLESERSQYSRDVEQVVNGYIEEAVTAAGLERSLPLFTGIAMTWPPVATKFTQPPQLLVRSPRDRIFREGDTLLQPGLDAKDVSAIEQRTTNNDTVSLVIPLGGIATYPSIVSGDGSYGALLELASHEWTHQYLAFWPLGQTWGSSADADTLNETTAEIMGRQLAQVIQAKHPGDFAKGEDGSPPPLPAPTADFNAVMHSLRLEVDQLLAAGKVSEAERRMDDTQKYLADHGIYVGKINQAYFAFYGTYATSPQSSNPIGPKVEKVWSLTQNVGLFLADMRSVRNVQDLDLVISRLEAATGAKSS